VTAGAAPDELPEPRLPEPEPEPEPEPAAEAAAAADEPEPAEAPSAGSPNGKTAAGGAASRREHAAT